MKLKQFFVIAVKTIERIDKFPSKYLLSPVLKEQIDLDFQQQYQPNKVGRQNDYFLAQEQYKEFVYKDPHGKVHIFNYLDVNFALAEQKIDINYYYFPDLHQLCFK